MDLVMIKYMLISLAGVFVSSVSQVMLKKSAMKKYDNPVREYLNPLVMPAYMLFIAATFMSIAAYHRIPLSMGAVLEASGYVYVTFFGAAVFKEKITISRLTALGLIISGVIVYSVLG